jgi:NADH:ubiquinone oxidoreductase subunit C
MLSTISCIDYPELDKRFELVYTLMSLDFPLILNIKTKISEIMYINSCSIFFKNGVWLEREIWDMFGVYFVNNLDLRRILTDYGFPYHPLRKTFPLYGYSEVFYNFITKQISYKNPNYFIQFKSIKNINSVWTRVV